MRHTLVETGPMPVLDDDPGPSTAPHSLEDMKRGSAQDIEATGELNMAHELGFAWSDGDDPMPQDYDGLTFDEKQAYDRILKYNPHSGDVVVGPLGDSLLEDLEKKIEQAPNFESAINVIDELNDTNPLHVVTLLEKIARHYGNSEAVTERIDAIIENTTEIAELAITGQHGTATPQAGVEGLVKAYNVASSPEIKKEIRIKLETAIKAASASGQIAETETYALDPLIAESALEVVADLKHVSLREEVDAEILLHTHAEEDAINQEIEEFEAQIAARRARIEELQKVRAEELRGKKTAAGAVSNLLRFGR